MRNQKQNQSGFDTPEEAVKAYLAGLRDNDLEQMADTFGDESEADNISRQYTILCGIDLIPEISSDKYLIIKESQDIQKLMNKLVLHPASNCTFSTVYFAICCVVVSQRCHRIVSLLRLAD
jgi:hypothetical protein